MKDDGCIFLWCRTKSTARTIIGKLDGALGYPRTDSRTDTACGEIVSSDGTSCVIRLSRAVWSHKHARHIALEEALEKLLTAAEWGATVLDRAADLGVKPVARISYVAVADTGKFTTATAAPAEKSIATPVDRPDVDSEPLPL